jgi:hypothetical protein
MVSVSESLTFGIAEYVVLLDQDSFEISPVNPSFVAGLADEWPRACMRSIPSIRVAPAA